MAQRMNRCKILTSVAVFLLLGSCAAVDDGDSTDADAPATTSPSAEAGEDPTNPPPTPAEETATPEPTQEEVWAANYNASGGSYDLAVAAALALKTRNVDAPVGALSACRSLDKERNLDRRVTQAQESFSLTSAPTYDQALAALDVTTMTICPEFAALQEAQSAERTKRLRVEERRRKKAEQRRQEQEAQEEEQQPQPESVYYANCTEVENAGAAPIYAGDPGYSSNLDRDGDGVACEQ